MEKGPEQTAEELEEKRKMAEDVSANRIMTNADFKAISNQQATKTVTAAKKRKRPSNWADKESG